jgi:hypothetical protein
MLKWKWCSEPVDALQPGILLPIAHDHLFLRKKVSGTDPVKRVRSGVTGHLKIELALFGKFLLSPLKKVRQG